VKGKRHAGPAARRATRRRPKPQHKTKGAKLAGTAKKRAKRRKS
jgi:hypothetical protein